MDLLDSIKKHTESQKKKKEIHINETVQNYYRLRLVQQNKRMRSTILLLLFLIHIL